MHYTFHVGLFVSHPFDGIFFMAFFLDMLDIGTYQRDERISVKQCKSKNESSCEEYRNFFFFYLFLFLLLRFTIVWYYCHKFCVEMKLLKEKHIPLHYILTCLSLSLFRSLLLCCAHNKIDKIRKFVTKVR